MARRSKARQVALQMLFQADLNPKVEPEEVRALIADRLSDEMLKHLAWDLYTGTMQHREELDETIQKIAENWKLSRMATTDRCILRLGCYELLKTNTPFRVVIDEGIQLGKKFGNKHSAQFVNGILDRLVPAEKRQREQRPSPPDVT